MYHKVVKLNRADILRRKVLIQRIGENSQIHNQEIIDSAQASLRRNEFNKTNLKLNSEETSLVDKNISKAKMTLGYRVSCLAKTSKWVRESLDMVGRRIIAANVYGVNVVDGVIAPEDIEAIKKAILEDETIEVIKNSKFNSFDVDVIYINDVKPGIKVKVLRFTKTEDGYEVSDGPDMSTHNDLLWKVDVPFEFDNIRSTLTLTV
jgi:hypothetical protein